MKSKLSKIFPIAFAILLLSFMVYPQIRESGEIQGTVTDAEGVLLTGVTVTVESPNLIGGAQSKVTGANGFYRFRSLTIGIYKIKVELTGFNTMVREGIRIDADKTLVVDFKMIQATVEEEVVVIGEIPTIDIKSSKTGAVVFTDTLLTAIPSGKSFEWIMSTAPGVDYYSSYGSGYASPNSYQFDGVDVTNPLWGGIWFALDYNVIKEATVQGLGLPAEYGHFTGTVMTAVSKSGSNKFSTLNEFWYNGIGWNSQNKKGIPAEEWTNPAIADEKYMTNPFYDIGLQLGGKLIHDKLWFFISGEYDRNTYDPPGTPVDRLFWCTKGFVKFTYQLNKSNKINVSGNRYNDRGEHTLASATLPPDVDLNNFMPGWYFNLSWTSIFSPTTFLDAKFGFKWHQSSQIPSNGIEIAGHYDYGWYKYSKNFTSYSKNKTWTYDTSVHFNHYIPEFIKGSHDFKLGTNLISYKILTAGGYPGNEMYMDMFGQNYMKYIRDPYSWDQYATTFTVFFQDRWTVTKRLTLNIGARYDHYWYRIPSPERGVVYNNWSASPRVGFTYDLLGDRKNIVKLHYSHYYETIQRNQFNSFENRYGKLALLGWTGTDWYVIRDYATTVREIATDPDVSHPWIWEISGGYERELFRDASLSINFYNRGIGKPFAIANMAAKYAPYTAINPGHDGIVGTADDQGTFQAWELINPGEVASKLINPKKGTPEWLTEDPKWYARGFEIRFTKRFSNRWQMMASYHYTRSKGNTSGCMGLPLDPNRLINYYGEQGGYYSQPHQFKLQGNVILPVIETSLGIAAQAMSGPNRTPTFRATLPHGSSYFYAEPPGKTKGDARVDIDMRVQKIFSFGGVKIMAMLDIFNVINNHETFWYFYTSYGPYFMKRYDVKAPRNYKLGLRITF